MVLRLAIFDLDGTLKQARDPYVYLHQGLGTWEACRPFTAQGLAGDCYRLQ
jgi:phosphoserine phosphatase